MSTTRGTYVFMALAAVGLLLGAVFVASAAGYVRYENGSMVFDDDVVVEIGGCSLDDARTKNACESRGGIWGLTGGLKVGGTALVGESIPRDGSLMLDSASAAVGGTLSVCSAYSADPNSVNCGVRLNTVSDTPLAVTHLRALNGTLAFTHEGGVVQIAPSEGKIVIDGTLRAHDGIAVGSASGAGAGTVNVGSLVTPLIKPLDGTSLTFGATVSMDGPVRLSNKYQILMSGATVIPDIGNEF